MIHDTLQPLDGGTIVDALMQDERQGVFRYNKLGDRGFADQDAREAMETMGSIEDEQVRLSYWHGLMGGK